MYTQTDLCPISDLYVGHEHDKYLEAEYEPENKEIYVNDCCGKWFYKLFPCCGGDPKSTFMHSWSGHRLGASKSVYAVSNIAVASIFPIE